MDRSEGAAGTLGRPESQEKISKGPAVSVQAGMIFNYRKMFGQRNKWKSETNETELLNRIMDVIQCTRSHNNYDERNKKMHFLFEKNGFRIYFAIHYNRMNIFDSFIYDYCSAKVICYHLKRTEWG